MKTTTEQEVSHTPGPWTVADSGIYSDRRDVRVATTKSATRGIPEPEEEANARLISAAPELLEACRLFLANAEDSESTVDQDGIEFHDIKLARAAIAQAEGSL